MASIMPGCSGAVLVLLPPGAFMPARLLLAPAGARLPAGVRVVGAVAASGRGVRSSVALGAASSAAAPGRGSGMLSVALGAGWAAGSDTAVPAVEGSGLGHGSMRGAAVAARAAPKAASALLGRHGTAMRTAAAGSEAANTADDDSSGMIFEELLQAEGDKVLGLLAEVAPPAAMDRVARYGLLKKDVTNLVAAATNGKEDKTGRAIALIRASYALVRVAYWAYPSDRLPALGECQLGFLEQDFVLTCLGDTDVCSERFAPVHLGPLTPIVGDIEPVGEELPDGDAALLTGVRAAVKTAASVAGMARSLYDGTAMRTVAAAAGSEAAKTGDDDSAKGKAMLFEDLLQGQGDTLLALVSEVAPPAAPDRVARYDDLKGVVTELVATAKGRPHDKMGWAIALVRAAYGAVRLAHWSYPSVGLPKLPEFQMGSLEQSFVIRCLGTDESAPTMDLGPLTPIVGGLEVLGQGLSDEDADLLRGVQIAVNTAAHAVRTAKNIYESSSGDQTAP